MKKITAMVLALGLAVPAQACHLFPVREKVVIETKTNYTATIVIGVVTLLAGLAGIGYMQYTNQKLINQLDIKLKENKALVLERDGWHTEQQLADGARAIDNRDAWQANRIKDTEIAAKQRTIDELRTQLAAKEEELRPLSTELAELRENTSADLADFQKDINEEVERIRTNSLATIGRLATKSRQAAETATLAQEHIAKADADLKAAQSRIKQLEALKAQLQQNVQNKETLVQQLREQIAGYRQDIRELNRQLKEAKK
jgi:chromosome segregation ATPase